VFRLHVRPQQRRPVPEIAVGVRVAGLRHGPGCSCGRWSFSAKFDGEFASGAQTYSGFGTVRYAW